MSMHYKKYALLIYILAVGLSFVCTIPVSASVSPLNDPFAEQWGFHDVGAYTAWTKTTGSQSVVVAVIDNGFDTFHPDLRHNAWKNIHEIPDNEIDDDANGYIDDVWGWSFLPEDTNHDSTIDEEEARGSNNPRPEVLQMSETNKYGLTMHHATAVAGIIGAVGNNAEGMSGIAPKVRLMNIRVVDESGAGSFALLSTAIHYAVDNGADVINISMIGAEDTAIHEAIEYAYARKVVVVAAAGNNMFDLNEIVQYPVCADKASATQKILGVSAIEESHQKALFSNMGSSCVDIAAPGVSVTSTVRFSPLNGLKEKYKGEWSGTSFATPFVSGAAALLKAIQPTWGPDEIFTALLSTTQHTPGQDEIVYANLFGAGLLQVDRAVQYAIDRVVSQRIFRSLLFVSPKNGNTEEGIENDTHTINTHPALIGIDDVASYSIDGTVQYITSHRMTRSERSMTMYSSDWEEEATFSVPASGALTLAVADVTGDGVLDLIVSPAYSDTQVFRVYTLSGTLQYEFSLHGSQHTGVSLAVTQDGRIVTFYEQEGNRVVDIFDHAFNEPREHFTVVSLEKRGSMIVGDVDGDRRDEVILGGAVGERPIVSIYELDGVLKRTFAVYDGYVDGFLLESGDYDKDGKDDILTIPRSNSVPVRAWTGKSKKLVEWSMLRGQSVTDTIALPQY